MRVESVAHNDSAHGDFVPANDNEDVITLDRRRSPVRAAVWWQRPALPRLFLPLTFLPGALERNPRRSFSRESPATGNPRPENVINDAS
jgi:hypothetical protein